MLKVITSHNMPSGRECFQAKLDQDFVSSDNFRMCILIGGVRHVILELQNSTKRSEELHITWHQQVQEHITYKEDEVEYKHQDFNTLCSSFHSHNCFSKRQSSHECFKCLCMTFLSSIFSHLSQHITQKVLWKEFCNLGKTQLFKWFSKAFKLDTILAHHLT